MNKFYKQILLFLFICVIFLLLTYVYTCVWNTNEKCKLFIKEGFEDASEQMIGTCYEERINYEKCLKSLTDDSISIQPVDGSIEQDSKSQSEKMAKINNEFTKVQQLLIEKKNHFHTNKQLIQELLGGGGAGEWLSSDTKKNIEEAIYLKNQMLEKYESILQEIQYNLNTLGDNWNDTLYENELQKIISVEKDLNNIFIIQTVEN
jgi:glutaredoxin